MSEWQPMETAPKNGTTVILRGAFEHEGKPEMLAVAGVFSRGLWLRDNNGYGFTVSCQPTHWMPLPPPPESAT